MASRSTLGPPPCVEEPTRRACPKEAGQGRDSQLPQLISPRPYAHTEEPRQQSGEDSASYFCPSGSPSAPTHCPTTPQQSSSCGHGKSQILLYHWGCCSAFNDITAKGICIFGAEWRGRQQEHRGEPRTRSGQQVTRPDATHGIQGAGRAGMVERLQALPSPLCYPVKWRDEAGCAMTGSGGDSGHGVCKVPRRHFIY